MDDFNKWWSERRLTRNDLGDSQAATPTADTAPTFDDFSNASRFRHSGWRVNRRRVWESMLRTAQSLSRRRSFGSCGSMSWIEQSHSTPGRFRIRHNHCNDRLCIPCGNTRSVKLLSAVRHLTSGKKLVFCTLTLCGKNEPLTNLLDKLYKSFRALRALPIWERVIGGCAFLEIKWSDKAQRWHPHLHILMESSYMPQGDLAECWRMITKDSFIVDIRRVETEDMATRYVTKYVTKPLSPTFLNTPKLLDEALTSLKGRRLIFCFGEWYGTPLDTVEDADLDFEGDNPDWKYFAPLELTLAQATSGQKDALFIIRALGVEGLWRASLDSS
ncbi:MAG: protein rep [Gemmatimonadaceae bacterium]